MAFEYIPGKTVFHRLDPRTKIVFFLTTIVLEVLWGDPIFLSVVLVAVLLLARLCGVPRNVITSFVKAVIFFIVGYCMLTMFFLKPPNPHLLFWLVRSEWFSLPIYVETLVQMLGLMAKMLGILLCVRLLLMITPVTDIVLGLVKMKFPVSFGIAMTTTFGYVPVLIDENRKIGEALRSRGWKSGGYNVVKKLKALLTEMLVPAIYVSFKRANEIAIALESKGFSYNISDRTFVKELEFTGNDYIAITILLATCFFGVLTSDMFLGYGTFDGLTLTLVKGLLGIHD